MPMIDGARSILWRRLDRPGHEAARVYRLRPHWRLEGVAVFAHEGTPWQLDYLVVCDEAWRTESAHITGWVGAEMVAIEVLVDAERRWRVNGVECPAVAGAVDIDLNWSPSTNLLPIRRLGLAVGAEAPVTAAWLRFPSFALEPLAQTYRRLAPRSYRYESGGGQFTADLEVDDAGLVIRYPGFCEAETSPPPVTIALESPRPPDTAALVRELDAYLEALYPPEDNHLLSIDALCQPDVRFFVARRGGEVLGCGALRIDAGWGEVKRMFVRPAARGLELGRHLLDRIEEEARRERLGVLRLETGTLQPEAIGLYHSAGFVERGPFGEYADSAISVFMEKAL